MLTSKLCHQLATTADDYKSKALSARGGAGQRAGIQNRPTGLAQQNHPESPATTSTILDSC